MPSRRNTLGQFEKGSHWRNTKPFWNRDWLAREYETRLVSAGDIAKRFGVSDAAIYFWLRKQGIARRNVSQARSVKRWVVEGEKNGMYGKCGPASPVWKGGVTPMRQALYASSKWKTAKRYVRKRDRSACRLCGSKHRIEIHHIETFGDRPDLATNVMNLIVLCRDCHHGMKRRESEYKTQLQILVVLATMEGA